jgi:hypothetical protein
MKSWRMIAIMVLGLLGALSAMAQAQGWPSDPGINLPICAAAGPQENVVMISDGAGGAIMAWIDKRNTITEIYAQRVDAKGFTLWPWNGVSVVSAADIKPGFGMVSDGAGGAIIVWSDGRRGAGEIFIQRIDGAGAVKWQQNGVAITSNPAPSEFPVIASDGAGGAIIAWQEDRGVIAGGHNIYAQKISRTGVLQWKAEGVEICVAAGAQVAPAIAGNGRGGAIIVWRDKRGVDADVYAQFVNSFGAVQWGEGGAGVCTVARDQDFPAIVTNGSDGAIVAWADYRSGIEAPDLYCQHIDDKGMPRWQSDGIQVGSQLDFFRNPPVGPYMAGDGLGDAILTWSKARILDVDKDIYVNKINADSFLPLGTDGVVICGASGPQRFPTVIGDGAGGAVIVWQDERQPFNPDIYAQRLNLQSDPSGNPLWAVDGVPISTADGAQDAPVVVTDGAEGAIVAWAESNSTSEKDVYAQRVDADGNLGSGSINGPNIGVSTHELDFGAVKIGVTKKLTLEVTNSGEVGLLISNIAIDDTTAFRLVSPVFNAVPSQGLEVIEVAFTPRIASSSPQTASLRIESNDPDEPIVFVSLTGIGENTGGGGVPVTIVTDPAGLELVVDNVSYQTPISFEWSMASSHTLKAPSPQTQGTGKRFVFQHWEDNSANATRTILVGSTATTFTAYFKEQFLLTTNVAPIGAGTVSVTPPAPNRWYDQSTAVAVTAVANSGYEFANWSGDLFGSSPSENLFMDSPKNIVANFVIPTADPNISLSTTSLDFGVVDIGNRRNVFLTVYNTGAADLQVTNVFTDNGSVFMPTQTSLPPIVKDGSAQIEVGFTPAAAVPYSGTMTIVSNDPDLPHAKVNLTGTGQNSGSNTVSIALNSDPSGLEVRVDATPYLTPQSFNWPIGSIHTFNVTTPQFRGGDTQFIFSRWEDNSTVTNRSVNANVPATFTAFFKTQHRINLSVNPAGAGTAIITPFSANGWHDQNASVTIIAQANSGFQFTNWSGDFVGTAVSAGLFIDAPKNIVANFVEANDSEPPTIGSVTSSAPSGTVNVGTGVTVAANVTDNSGVSWVKLFYRQGGAATFVETPMTLAGAQYQGAIPAGAINSRGLEFYIEAADVGGNNIQRTPSQFLRVAVQANALQTGIKGGRAASAYRMFSVPLMLNNKSLVSNIEDDLGAYDRKKWRLFHDDGRSDFSKIPEYPNVGALDPGKAFWLITAADEAVAFLDGTSVNAAVPYEIALQPGWNAIGLPFNFPVGWNDIMTASGLGASEVDPPYLYEGTYSLPSRLESFKGYYVFNKTTRNLTLRIPPKEHVAALAKNVAIPSVTQAEPGGWRLMLVAQCGETRDTFTWLGMSHTASEAWDAFDLPEPPGVGDYVAVSFPHSEWPQFPGKYGSDIRPLSSRGAVWDLEVRSNVAGEKILLGLKGERDHASASDETAPFPPKDLPEGFRAILIDPVARVAIDLLERSSYQILSTGDPQKPHHLRLIVGTPEFASEHNLAVALIPARFELSQNFPNPLRAALTRSTLIRYTLPEASRVTLVVFDLLGHEVRRLVEREQQAAGYHLVLWDGRNTAGQNVVSGMYFYRLEAGNRVSTKKMLIMR